MIKVGVFLFLGVTLVVGVPLKGKFGIFGGIYANPRNIPFQVIYAIDDIAICSGVIISPTVAMTAAHCIKNIEKGKESSVYAGVINLRRRNPNGVRKQIVKVMPHTSYYNMSGSNHNDIALLFLNTTSPFKFNNFIQPAVLPSEHENYQNSIARVVVSGWGVEDSKGTRSRRLKYAALNLIPRDRCIEMGGDIGINVICAGSKNGSRNACEGDSGGPLLIGNKVIGLVSFGWPCGLTDRPTAFTDLAKLRKWIRSNTNV